MGRGEGGGGLRPGQLPDCHAPKPHRAPTHSTATGTDSSRHQHKGITNTFLSVCLLVGQRVWRVLCAVLSPSGPVLGCDWEGPLLLHGTAVLLSVLLPAPAPLWCQALSLWLPHLPFPLDPLAPQHARHSLHLYLHMLQRPPGLPPCLLPLALPGLAKVGHPIAPLRTTRHLSSFHSRLFLFCLCVLG